MYKHQNAIDLFIDLVKIDSPSMSEKEIAEYITAYANKNRKCKATLAETRYA